MKYWKCGSADYMITPPLVCVSKHQITVLKYIQLPFFICAKTKLKNKISNVAHQKHLCSM